MELFDPFDHRIHDNPYPIYRQLRDEHPVYWNEKYGFWVLSRYADCVSALRDFKTYCNRFGQTLEPTAPGQMPILLTMDPPEHTRLRKVVGRTLTPERVEHLGVYVRELAQSLLRPFANRGEMDIIQDFAAKLPMAIICRMLQVPMADQDELREWCDWAVHRDDGVFRMTDKGVESCTKIFEYFAALIERRRADLSDGDDFLTLLIRAHDAGEMSHEELLGFCFLLVLAGNETTTKLIGNMTYQFDKHPEQRALLLQDTVLQNKGLMVNAVEETMRFDGPTQLQARTLTKDVELHGRSMKEGDKVGILFVSANRDERKYPDAEVFDIRRGARDHVGFGAGVHACLGAALARLEGAIAFDEILKMMPDYRVDESGLERMHSPNVRGYTRVPVTFGRR